MSELKERLDNLRALMQEPEFLEGKGLSNEVNIRIFCYDPSDEMMVRHFIEQIMTDQSMNCHLIEHNLYECFILGKHTARNGVAGISPPRREFQKC